MAGDAPGILLRTHGFGDLSADFQARASYEQKMISETMPLLLGSASPRRKDILAGLGIPLRILAADIPEEVEPGEQPLAYLERIVQGKLDKVTEKAAGSDYAGILVADTTVVIDSTILGKPKDVAEAEVLLKMLVGRTHQVFTRYAIYAKTSAATRARTVLSEVSLRQASAAEIHGYANTREGLDKAGAYAAQGIGTFLVERIHGSYSNVVGLPACEVVLDLQQLGLLERFPI